MKLAQMQAMPTPLSVPLAKDTTASMLTSKSKADLKH
jgi:hypothetical protein